MVPVWEHGICQSLSWIDATNYLGLTTVLYHQHLIDNGEPRCLIPTMNVDDGKCIGLERTSTYSSWCCMGCRIRISSSASTGVVVRNGRQ